MYLKYKADTNFNINGQFKVTEGEELIVTSNRITNLENNEFILWNPLFFEIIKGSCTLMYAKADFSRPWSQYTGLKTGALYDLDIHYGDMLIVQDGFAFNVTTQQEALFTPNTEAFINRNCRLVNGADLASDDIDEDLEPVVIPISTKLVNRFKQLGLVDSDKVRSTNVGESDYSEHIIQPWSIWKDYNLDPWDADIIKRVLRTKTVNGKTPEQSRIEDYKKIIHVCNEKIRQLENV